ncbi:MAG: IPT/TIG domain-containing protein [Steroidobacteraceae bacterium]
MLPQNVLSTVPVVSAFLPPRNVEKLPLIDYELGGVAIQNPLQGLRVQTWTGEVIGSNVVLSAPLVAPVTIFTQASITEFQFTFDQNMQPFVAYMLNGVTARFRWFDTTISQFVTTTLPTGSYSLRCSLDDKRQNAGIISGQSDVVLTYFRAGTLYFRMQRDRYTIEYTLKTGYGAHVIGAFGMNLKFRLQWQIAPVLPFSVPTLASLVPNTVLEAAGPFDLVVNGSGFTSATLVQFNGSGRVTTFVSPNQIIAQILAADTLVAGVYPITATNPYPGGGLSSSLPLTVTETFFRMTEDGAFRITEASDFRIQE